LRHLYRGWLQCEDFVSRSLRVSV
jgi:hypothetical protein